MCALAASKQTTVRAFEAADLRPMLRLIDTAWRVHLRVSPVELNTKAEIFPCLLAEDNVGVRGFMMIEPVQPGVGLVVAAGLRDTWGVKPYLDSLLPRVEQAAINESLKELLYIGNTPWLTEELQARGFEVREWVMAFERVDTQPPPEPIYATAFIRTAHLKDLPILLKLDKLAFHRIWHKSPGNFSEALAKAVSFTVAVVGDHIAAYEWCELYGQHAHLTRLAVHPDYQGQGIGAQLLYQAIVDALNAGADLITLNTQESNYRSRGLYERFGFVDTGQRIPVLWKDLV